MAAAKEDIDVSEFHAEQLQAYLKFAALKRNEALRVIEVAFKEVAEAELPHDDGAVMTKDEVQQILDGVQTSVKGDVQKELLHTAHTTALVLRQLFNQAEEIMLDLHVDVNQLENEFLLREIADRDPSVQTEPGTKLKPMSKAVSGSAVKHAMDKKAIADDRFRQLQVQCTEILKKKTALEDELDRLKKSSSSSSSSSAPAPAPSQAPAPAAAAAAAQSNAAEMEGMKKQMEELKKQLMEEKGKTAKAEAELTKKIQMTTPFLNLKKMIKQKNDTMRVMRELLHKHAPGVPLPGDATDAAVSSDDQ